MTLLLQSIRSRCVPYLMFHLQLRSFRCHFSGDFADLPSEVILMREISAGVPINDPIAPAVIPV